MPRENKDKVQARIDSHITVLQGAKDEGQGFPPPPSPVAPAAPSTGRKPRTSKPKQTALDKVEGRQQEFIAEALLAVHGALEKAEKAVKDLGTYKDLPPLLNAVARAAEAQADIAQLINAKPSRFKDPAALQTRLRDAISKLYGS